MMDATQYWLAYSCQGALTLISLSVAPRQDVSLLSATAKSTALTLQTELPTTERDS